MFTVRIAELNILIENKYSFVKEQCTDYMISDTYYDFSVSVTDEEINDEAARYDIEHSSEFIESICIYRKIAECLPEYNAFIMHCAAVEKDGNAYCFAAKSGVGKTTHAMLWLKAFGNSASIINGDKPIFRIIDGSVFVYGTPWGGKENFHSNKKAVLKGLCFLKRSDFNSISTIAAYDALKRSLEQLFFKNNSTNELTFELLSTIIKTTRVWELSCNISTEAAQIAYHAMSEEDNNESNV